MAVQAKSEALLRQVLAGIISGDIEVVDLTQPLNEETPVISLPDQFEQTKGFKYKRLSNYDDKGPAWYWNDFEAGEHCGTHFDAPIHWISGKNGDSVDTIPMKNLIAEACVIDCRQQAAENPDYLLTVEDILKFEEQYGKIPEHSYVIMHTGWGKYGQDKEKYFNVGEDGMSHTPGPSVEAAKFLAQERKVLGFGVETVGTDAGIAPTFDPAFPSHYYMHEANRYGLAQLTNIDKLPPRGSIIVAAPLKITNGSGSPIRAFALVPRN